MKLVGSVHEKYIIFFVRILSFDCLKEHVPASPRARVCVACILSCVTETRIPLILGAGTRRGEAPDKLKIWRPFKLTFFKRFQCRKGLEYIFEVSCPNYE